MKYMNLPRLSVVTGVVLIALVCASSATATTLEVHGEPKKSPVTIEASLEKGTSALLKDSLGTTTDTCTASTVHGNTVEPYSATKVGGPITALTFTECSHTTDVIAKGSLSIEWIGGTNGTVTSSGAEVQVKSTFFGVTAICKTGAGTDIGTLTGKSGTVEGDKHATMDINATIDCGSLGKSSWTGSYIVTSPTGLGVIS